MERPRLHLPESVGQKTSQFFSYARRFKDWVGDNKIDAFGLGLVGGAVINGIVAVGGIVSEQPIEGIFGVTGSIGMMEAAYVVGSRSRMSRIAGVAEGVTITIGNILLQSRQPDWQLPGFILSYCTTIFIAGPHALRIADSPTPQRFKTPILAQ